jgi:hypothetical protein
MPRIVDAELAREQDRASNALSPNQRATPRPTSAGKPAAEIGRASHFQRTLRREEHWLRYMRANWLLPCRGLACMIATHALLKDAAG